jgi:hypothetical protein
MVKTSKNPHRTSGVAQSVDSAASFMPYYPYGKEIKNGFFSVALRPILFSAWNGEDYEHPYFPIRPMVANRGFNVRRKRM